MDHSLILAAASKFFSGGAGGLMGGWEGGG